MPSTLRCPAACATSMGRRSQKSRRERGSGPAWAHPACCACCTHAVSSRCTMAPSPLAAAMCRGVL